MNDPGSELAFDRKHGVLLVRYSVEVTGENLLHFEGLLRAFVARYGTTDIIMDFSGAPKTVVSSDLIHARAQRPSLVPDKQRILVAPTDHLFGMLRMYGGCHGTNPPVVRTLDEAFTLLQLVDPIFESVKV